MVSQKECGFLAGVSFRSISFKQNNEQIKDLKEIVNSFLDLSSLTILFNGTLCNYHREKNENNSLTASSLEVVS